VLKDEFADRHPPVARLLDDLMSLAHRHPWVVRATKDEQRRLDPVDGVDGEDLIKEAAVLIRGTALRLPKFAPPLARILEERDEVGDTDAVDAALAQYRREFVVDRGDM